MKKSGLEPVGVASKEHNRVAPQDDKAESVGARHAVPYNPRRRGTCHAGVDGWRRLGTEAWGGGTAALAGSIRRFARRLISGRGAGDEGAVSWWRAGGADAASGAQAVTTRRGDLFRRCAGAIGSRCGVGARESRGVSAIICRGGEGVGGDGADSAGNQTPPFAKPAKDGAPTNPSASQHSTATGHRRRSRITLRPALRDSGQANHRSPITVTLRLRSGQAVNRSPFGSAQGKPVTAVRSYSVRGV